MQKEICLNKEQEYLYTQKDIDELQEAINKLSQRIKNLEKELETSKNIKYDDTSKR